jgi:5-methylcytosine-specific restriction endonuclease McrA
MKKKKITKALLKKKEKRLLKRKNKELLNQWKADIIARDNNTCQRCLKNMTGFNKHVHHIISLQAVKRKYPELYTNINNGILLCGQCHKFNYDSPHQGGFEFTLWLEKNKPGQYRYLKKIVSKSRPK